MPNSDPDLVVTTVLSDEDRFSVCSDATIISHVLKSGAAGKSTLLSMFPGTYSVDATGFSTLKVLSGSVRIRSGRRTIGSAEGGGKLDFTSSNLPAGPLVIETAEFTQALLLNADQAASSIDRYCIPKIVPPKPRRTPAFLLIGPRRL